MRQLRTLYHTQIEVKIAHNMPSSFVDLNDTLTYDQDEAADQAFDAAFKTASRYGEGKAEITCTNALPGHTVYTVYFPTTHVYHYYRVIGEDDGIDLI